MTILRILFLLVFSPLLAHALDCPPATCGVAQAHLMPGADVGQKIAASIAALPANGGYVDGTGLTSGNLTAFTIPRGVTVKLAPGTYTLLCGAPLIVNDGAKLFGSGVNSPGATTIKLGNGCNHDVVQGLSVSGPTGWWHNSEIAEVRIDGNKTNNPTGGYALAIYQMGETSQVRRVILTGAKKDGFFITGSQAGTSTVDNVTANWNDGAGFHLEDFKSAILWKSIGGDNNAQAILVTNANQGGGSLTVLDMKSEGSTDVPILITGGPTCPPCAAASVNLTLIGGSMLSPFNANATMIRVDAANQPGPRSPYLQIVGMTTGNGFTTIIDDKVASVQIATDGPTSYHSFFGYAPGGKWMRFGKNGFETYPAMLVTQP